MDVVIAGAGISGLTAAISLRRSGHKVTIYERSSLNNEIGAAINVPPNVSRFLVPWGMDPMKYKLGVSQGMYFISPFTLEEFARHNHDLTAKIFGQELFYAHRVDLHEGLKDLATEPGGVGIPAVIHPSCKVISYDPESPSFTLSDGRVITADLIIAADGVNSIATAICTGNPTPAELGQGVNCCYRFLIPTSDIISDPETKWFYQELGCTVWSDLPNNRRLISYAVRKYAYTVAIPRLDKAYLTTEYSHEVHNFVALCYNDEHMAKKEDWLASVDKSEVLKMYAGFHPKILAVINKATEVKRWPLLYRPPIETWHKGRMVLTGDAAHPMLPHHAQGGAQGIEDGLALGLSMYGLTDPSKVEERILLFEKIRRNRAASLQILSSRGFEEPVSEELAQFLDGRPIPATMKDIIHLEYGDDVLKKTIEVMTEFDTAWKIPGGFFPVQDSAQTDK